MAVTRTLAAPKARPLAPSLASARANAIPASSRLTYNRTATTGGKLPAIRSLAPIVPSSTAVAKRPGGLGGFFNNLGEMVHGFIPGIAHFVGDVAKDVAFVPHLAIDAARGRVNTGNFLHAYLPASTSVVQSFGHTAGDIVNPTHFLKAWREGTLASKLIEDIGNVAIVGGTAAKVLGAGTAVSEMTADQAARMAARYGTREATAEEIAAAGKPPLEAAIPEGPAGQMATVAKPETGYYTTYRGLAGRAFKAGDIGTAESLNRIGNLVKKGSTLGLEAANLPALPYRLAGKGISSALDLGEGGVRGAITAALPEELRWKLGQNKIVKYARGLAVDATVRMQRATSEASILADQLGLSDAEKSAVLRTIEIPRENLITLDKVADDQVLGDMLNNEYQDREMSARPSVSDIRVAAKYAQRSLPEATLNAMDQVQRKVLDVAEARKGRAIQEGLHPEQLGTKLRGTVVEKITGKLRAKSEQFDKSIGRAQQIADRHVRNQRITDAMANDLPDPTAMNRPEIRSAIESVRGRLDDAVAQHNDALANGTTHDQIATAARVDDLLQQAEDIKTQAGWMRPQRSVFAGRDPATGEMLRRESPTGNPSPNERIRIRQGTLAERANWATNNVERLKRGKALVDQQIADLENNLNQRFQDRFHTRVNLPAVTQLTNAMFKGTRRIATLARQFGAEHGLDISQLGDMSAEQIAAMFDNVGLSDAQRAQLEHSLTAEQTLGKVADVMETATAASDGGQHLNSPYDVMDTITQADLPVSAQHAVEEAWNRFLNRRTNFLNKVWHDWTEAMPARFRRAGQDAQRQVAALLEEAHKANEDVPGTGDQYLKLAEETMTTMQDMVDSGFDPQHLTGGREATAGGVAAHGGSARGLTAPSQRAEHVSRHGIREQGLEAYARVEAEQAKNWVIRRRNEFLGEQMGRRVDSFPEIQAAQAEWNDLHPGEVVPPTTLAHALGNVTDEAGLKYKAMDPRAQLTPESVVVPEKVFDAFSSPDQVGLGWRALGRTNRAFKTWVLPFSPRWQVGNAIGNVLQAAMHADVGPVELARQMVGLVRDEGWKNLWAQEGRSNIVPVNVTESGLNQLERGVNFGEQDLQAGTSVGQRVQNISRASYRVNTFVDNMTRSSVYLAKLAEGEGSEQALRTTLNALGDYTKLSPLERNKIRQVLPFYSWLKHSLTATLRLPIYSPTRAAFYMNLQNLYSQDPNLRQIIGQRVQIGPTSLLNFGTAVPLADIDTGASLLNPANWGGALAPGIKLAAAVGAGWDLNRMDRLSRPQGQFTAGPFGKENVTPLTQLLRNPLQGAWEIGWQATQQGPSQIRSIRDLALGSTGRYAGTGYTTPFKKPDNRSLWQIARILGLPSVQYDPRLTQQPGG